ncbi:MAG: hypothetical protein KC442_23360, partial [Thermomicrobiales bacterium]|nr:hypothetical protein [Thermomicrobiales bacterium]
MTELDNLISPDREWQISENAKLAKRFLRSCSARPERCASLTRAGAHVLLPPDEPCYARLREANLRIAEQLMREGREFDYWLMNADGSAAVVSSLSG